MESAQRLPQQPTESPTSSESLEASGLSWIAYSETGSETLEEIRVPSMEEMIAALGRS